MPINRPNAAHGCRLYLVTAVVSDPDAFAPKLAAAVGCADVAAVLLRLADADERAQIDRVKALAPMVQDRGGALMIDGLPAIVARSGADGAHLTGIEQLNAAHASLTPKWIAGAGGLHTRHDAMLAAEAGADYVMFGEPDARGGRPPFQAIVERISWWAEVFEPPCVGYAAGLDEVGPLARAGADFVALGDFIWNDACGPTPAVAAAARRVAMPESVQ